MMDSVHGILHGLMVAGEPINLLHVLIGVFIGTMISHLPGIGPSAGIALLIPVTFGMNPTGALIMLAGIYYGCMYGGAVTAILLNTPGDAAAVMTVLDGYPMARKGRAGAGYAFRKLDIPKAPLIFGLILGVKLEQSFRQAMTISGGDPLVFLKNPISASILTIALGMVTISLWIKVRSERRLTTTLDVC